MLLRNGVIAVTAAALALASSGAALAEGGKKDGRGAHGVELKKPRSKRDFPVAVLAQT